MILLIESMVLCALFTIPILIGSKKPISMIHNYPQAIIEKAYELKLIEDIHVHKSKKTVARKVFASILLVILLAVAVRCANGAGTLVEGFGYAYILWTIVNLYDVIIMDILWFCHDKRFVIPGTEGMKEYKDYRFHIKACLKGMLCGLPVALLVGCMVAIIS